MIPHSNIWSKISPTALLPTCFGTVAAAQLLGCRGNRVGPPILCLRTCPNSDTWSPAASSGAVDPPDRRTGASAAYATLRSAKDLWAGAGCGMGALRRGRAKAFSRLLHPHPLLTSLSLSSSGPPVHARPAAQKGTMSRPRIASAAVTLQGGDGSPARGKSEPAPSARSADRTRPDPAKPGRETPQTQCKRVRLKFSLKLEAVRGDGIDRLGIVRRHRQRERQ